MLIHSLPSPLAGEGEGRCLKNMKWNKERPIKNIRFSGKIKRRLCCGLQCILVAICLFIAPLQTEGIMSPDEGKKETAPDAYSHALKERWGIEVIGIRRTAAEYMLNFQYRVTDPDKALALFDRKIKPYLIDQTSGAAMMVPSPPKIGPLRQTTRNSGPVAGKTYFIFFANPAKFIKQGNKVTVVIGDFRAENLTVK
jgi:hypothetical protein